MSIPGKHKLVRIFIGEQVKHKGAPLYEVITLKAREMKLAGATVIKGVMGYGASSVVHTSKVLRLSEDLPMVIEIVDQPEKIDHFLPFLDEVLEEGLVTVEEVDVYRYVHRT